MTLPLPTIDPLKLIQPRRKIRGISAVLLPFTAAGEVDWASFTRLLSRTVQAGLVPAVNMDTGYTHLIDDAIKRTVLERTRNIVESSVFYAGAFVGDRPGDRFDLDGYRRQIDLIQQHGGTPVIFQSYGLTQQDSSGIVESYQQLARACDIFLGFELTTDLAPFGRIYELETYAGLMRIPQCAGAKHSSFHREPEWQRLTLRNMQRPDFVVYTGNDFAIDMVMYGSDYLLGLSTFAPDLFARRDRMWEQGDPAFHELNDVLQYLGQFAFRTPGAAYKHTAAQFLRLRGWISDNATHPRSPSRPESDVEVLREIGARLGVPMT